MDIPETGKCNLQPSSLVFIMLLSGVKKPQAAGRMTAACLSFPTTVWSSFWGTRLRRNMVCVSLINRLAFAAGRHTVRLIPQNLKPITSLVVSKFPPPFFSLLSEIGSFPLACLVVAVSGKTA